jgi:hypothetical protein
VNPALQLASHGRLLVDRSSITRWRDAYRERGFLRLPEFLEASLLGRIQRLLDVASFVPEAKRNRQRELANELRVRPDQGVNLMMLTVMNHSELFRAVEEIIASGTIRSYVGRIRREVPGAGHFVSWHSDPDERRLCGISVNLSREPYAGGAFQLREKSSGRLLIDVANTTPGDALLFRVAQGYHHRVTPVEGTVARTTSSGWFYASPDARTVLAAFQPA